MLVLAEISIFLRMATIKSHAFATCRVAKQVAPRTVVPRAVAKDLSLAQRAAAVAVATVMLASPVSSAIAGEFDVRESLYGLIRDSVLTSCMSLVHALIAIR